MRAKLAEPTLHPNGLKPPAIPPGFVLVVDSREQRPLFNGNGTGGAFPGLVASAAALPVGDYSIQGFEDRFCIERKQISDFYQYIGKDRARTAIKLQQFKEISARGGFCGLVIEAEERDLLTGYILSRVSPETARQSLVSFEVRYGVHVYYSRSRSDIQRWVLDRAIKFYKMQREVNQS